mmetsp:Transcript_16765/g.46959  ORF Transcript_16765/g.46959 Transcript_16765/m.46959 type:complete len:241 (-) Transcript_16765:1641-2363(-)
MHFISYNTIAPPSYHIITSPQNSEYSGMNSPHPMKIDASGSPSKKQHSHTSSAFRSLHSNHTCLLAGCGNDSSHREGKKNWSTPLLYTLKNVKRDGRMRLGGSVELNLLTAIFNISNVDIAPSVVGNIPVNWLMSTSNEISRVRSDMDSGIVPSKLLLVSCSIRRFDMPKSSGGIEPLSLLLLSVSESKRVSCPNCVGRDPDKLHSPMDKSNNDVVIVPISVGMLPTIPVLPDRSICRKA